MKLRPYQQDAIDSIYRYFNEHETGNPVISMATGTGKSHVISGFIASAIRQWAETRFIILCHSKELVAQDFSKIHEHLPLADAGVYSAGLNSKETDHAIIFAGIQSAHKHPNRFHRPDLIIVDEAHAIPNDSIGIYRKFLSAMKSRNPDLRIIGFTATPYRMKGGSLVEGPNALFTDIIYETNLHKMIDEGWLSNISSKRTAEQIDTSKISIQAGDFKADELEELANDESTVRRAVAEIIAYGKNRKSWLIFCSGVKHAEHVASIIREYGITCEAIHQGLSNIKRDELLLKYKRNEIQCLTNMNILTTGFDHTAIDLIACLRPTQSPGLWVQMVGRGMRISEDKKDCLILDFSGNTERFGPIDMIQPKGQRKGRLNKDAPVKWCPECLEFNHISAKICCACGYEFPIRDEITHNATASEEEILSRVEEIEITDVKYSRHNKMGKPSTLRVDYYSGIIRIASEWLSLDASHDSYAWRKTRKWWIDRTNAAMPESVAEALFMNLKEILSVPRVIKIRVGGKYPEILGYDFRYNSISALADNHPSQTIAL